MCVQQSDIYIYSSFSDSFPLLVILFHEVPVQDFPHLKIRLAAFSLLSYSSSLYTLDTSAVLDICMEKLLCELPFTLLSCDKDNFLI